VPTWGAAGALAVAGGVGVVADVDGVEPGTTIGLDSMKPPVEPLMLPTHPVIVTVCRPRADVVDVGG